MWYNDGMKSLLIILLASLGVVTVSAAEELAYDPFPKFASVPKGELVTPNGGLQIAADGSFVQDGQPRYFPATCWYGGFEFLAGNNKGCCDDLKWLYDEMPTYESVSRLGFDATGLSCTFKWMRMYRPNQKEFPCDWKKSLPSFKCGIPLYMDFTASEWGLGSMNMGDRPVDPDFKGVRGKWPDEEPKKHRKASLKIDDDEDGQMSLDDFDPGKKQAEEESKKPKGPPKGYLGPEAFTVGHNHWVAYSTVHPKGRKIWLNMWKYGAQEVLDLGLKPWCYELFNEPSSYDHSDYAHQEFAKLMTAKYGADYKTAQPAIVQSVEYSRYLEECFASLMDEGTAELKALDPQALTTFQPCTIRTRGLDLYRCYKNLGVVCSQTGGRGLMEAHMLRGLADGKPIVDNEMYFGGSTNSIRQSYLDQYQRGFNMSMSFKWSADRSGYNFMNRNNVRPDALLGVRLAKRDILDVNEFFTPRNRGVPHETAILFSNPTERYSQHAEHSGYKFFDQAVVGVDAAQLPMDVLWEEDLTNSVSRLSRYKVLVTAGTDCVYPGTLKTLRAWVEKGGVLVCFNRVPSLDEYGRENPEAFAIQPGEQEVGRGRIFFFAERMSSQAMGEKVVVAAATVGVKPDCEVLDAAEEGKVAANPIEVHSAVKNGMRAWIVTARTMSDKVVRFKPADLDSSMLMIRVWNEVETRNGESVMVAHRQAMRPDAEGYYGLFLCRGSSVLLVAGKKDAVLKRYPKADDVVWEKTVLKAEDVVREGLAKLEARKEAKASGGFRYAVEADRVTLVDLAKLANAKMQDRIGVNPAAKGPINWDTEEFAGVPVRILRYDQNGFKDCVLVKGSIKPIELPADAGRIFFLHTGALNVSFEYADGMVVESESGSPKKKPGLWCWSNTRPNAQLKQMRLSPLGTEAPVVLAVSAEKRDERCYIVPGEDLVGCMSSKGVRCYATNGVCRVELDESATSWSTAGIGFKNPVPCAKGMYKKITVEVNRLPDQWGNYHDHATPQFRLFGKDRKGALQLGANWMVGKYESGPFFYRTDNNPDTWETMTFFVSDGFLPSSYREATTLRLQFQQMPAEHSGLAFRNVTFWRDPDYKPSEDDEPIAKPGAPAAPRPRKGPKFEVPAADAGLSLDLD